MTIVASPVCPQILAFACARAWPNRHYTDPIRSDSNELTFSTKSITVVYYSIFNFVFVSTFSISISWELPSICRHTITVAWHIIWCSIKFRFIWQIIDTRSISFNFRFCTLMIEMNFWFYLLFVRIKLVMVFVSQFNKYEWI